MSWHSVGEFLAMGGFAPFVWGAYGVTFVLIAAEVWLLFRQSRELVYRLWRLQQLEIKPTSIKPASKADMESSA
ncbi:MAG TPA: heme exporter protein CcmD [Rhodocyclaceae bacterium]|nr:heme exporter protein CcmD [Rhodocyclaceae bacterium]